MKSSYFKVLLCAFAMCSLSVYAQNQRPAGAGGPGQQRMTAQTFADQRTAEFTKELGLTDKQTKEVAKLYLTQARKFYPTQPSGGAGGGGGRRPAGGGGGGDGFDGGGAAPASVNFDAAPRAAVKPKAETEKDIANRDKKMQKLLDETQYAKWQTMETAFNEQNKELVERLLSAPQGGARPQGGQRP